MIVFLPPRRIFLCLALLLSLSAGCLRYQYDVAMTITPDGKVERILQVDTTAEGNELPLAEQMRLETLYGARADAPDGMHAALTGTFQGQLPDDVGGHGRVARWETSLGSLITYRERFRGSYDFADQIAQREQSCDRLCELLCEWAQQAAIDPARGAQLQAFINGPLHADMRNAIMLIMLEQAHWKDGMPADSVSRESGEQLVQFLLEQGYLTDAMLPQLRRMNWQSVDDLKLPMDMLALKFSSQHKESLTELLPAMKSAESFETSLREFLESKGIDTEQFGELLLACVGNPMQVSDRLDLSIKAESEPFDTNGLWDPKESLLTWDARLELPGSNIPTQVLPALCYASWSTPNIEQQQAHFGRVLLRSELLGQYVMWRTALTVDEGVDWDLFLLSLSPHDDLPARIQEFQFKTEESNREVRDRLAGNVRTLFGKALGN